jgi:hypothetical protein
MLLLHHLRRLTQDVALIVTFEVEHDEGLLVWVEKLLGLLLLVVPALSWEIVRIQLAC